MARTAKRTPQHCMTSMRLCVMPIASILYPLMAASIAARANGASPPPNCPHRCSTPPSARPAEPAMKKPLARTFMRVPPAPIRRSVVRAARDVALRELETVVLVEHLPLPRRFLEHERHRHAHLGLVLAYRKIDGHRSHDQGVPLAQGGDVHRSEREPVRSLRSRKFVDLGADRVPAPIDDPHLGRGD